MRSKPLTLSLALLLGACAQVPRGESGAQVASAPPTLEVEATPVVPETRFVELIPGVTLELVRVEEIGAWIGRTEVTWDQFLPYCAFDRLETGTEVDGIARPSKPLETHPYDRGWGEGEQPAVGMSWNSARLYCQWLTLQTGGSFRLPTETEWRAACGEAPVDVTEQAWTWADQRSGTAAVGLKQPNEFGLHDMLGNLTEYVAAEDGSEPFPLATLGGSFMTPIDRVGPDARLDFDPDWTLADSNWPPGRWWIPGGYQLGFRVLCEELPR